MKMTKVELDEWLEALRSDRYKQGKNCLKMKHPKGQFSYCCLGVLCELNIERVGLKLTQADMSEEWLFNGVEGLLPEVLSQRYSSSSYGFFVPESMLTPDERKLITEKARFVNTDGTEVAGYHLTTLNDKDFPFTRLAEIIEQRVEVIPA